MTPVRALILTASFAISLAAPSLGVAQEPQLVGVPEPPVTLVASPAGTTAPADTSDLVAVSKAAYETCWSKRESGDLEGALSSADAALRRIEQALQGDLDASRRRDLVELKSKLGALRDLARHGLEARAESKDAKDGAKKEAKDDGTADPNVLNAPAIEDLRPQMNADVLRYIQFFTGGGRSTFERWLKRSGRYMNLFREVLKREGLPPDLVHLVFVESGFNVHAKSVSAAVGPWQFLRSTGQLWGLTVNQWVDERRDPEKSTVAAARYLKHLYTIFGDWPLALASYNAGEGTVLRAIKNQGTTNYWDLRLPKQTEEYVPQFMAVLTIAREPEKYGFAEVDFDDPMDFDELALRGTVDLHAVARLAECEYETLRDLNPAVRGAAAPGRDGITVLRVPQGKAEEVLAKLQGGATIPAADLSVKHRVRRGETIQRIANQYHVNATALARENGIGRARPLRRGMVLTIRSSARAPVQVAELEKDDPRRSTAYVPPRKIGVPAKLDGSSEAEGRQTVTVRRGETLASIAAREGVRVDDIKRWNRLKTSSVRRGTRLKIRTSEAPPITAADLAADSAQVAAFSAPRPSRRGSSGGVAVRRVIVVRSGETLGTIASRNGTTIHRLKKANGLRSSVIRAGQRLRIPA
jgi:membrane-bound lytic murein transglycosylase D